MSPVSLMKAVLSIVGALLLTAAALFECRRRGMPPRPEPQPKSESPVSSPGKGGASGASVLLGAGGILALLGTMIPVVIGHIGLREQLGADQSIRATEQAEERSQRESERVEALYNHAIDTLASGTPELQVVGVYEFGGVIKAPVRNDYDEPVREILAGICGSLRHHHLVKPQNLIRSH
jgi:hypothetical protein